MSYLSSVMAWKVETGIQLGVQENGRRKCPNRLVDNETSYQMKLWAPHSRVYSSKVWI